MRIGLTRCALGVIEKHPFQGAQAAVIVSELKTKYEMDVGAGDVVRDHR